jgi:hypothetical protein
VDGSDIALNLPDGSVVHRDGRVVKPRLEVVSSLATTQPAVQLAREIESGRAAARTLDRIHRKLGDLPAEAEKMNAIAAVLMYSQIGLRDEDIAVALKTSLVAIEALKKLDAYQQLEQMFDTTVFEDAKRTANHLVARASSRAVQRLVEAVESTDESVAVVASDKITKMAGIGAGEEQNKRIGGLNIVIKRKGESLEDEIRVEVKQ